MIYNIITLIKTKKYKTGQEFQYEIQALNLLLCNECGSCCYSCCYHIIKDVVLVIIKDVVLVIIKDVVVVIVFICSVPEEG